jgi:hypothetical protein
LEIISMRILPHTALLERAGNTVESNAVSAIIHRGVRKPVERRACSMPYSTLLNFRRRRSATIDKTALVRQAMAHAIAWRPKCPRPLGAVLSLLVRPRPTKYTLHQHEVSVPTRRRGANHCGKETEGDVKNVGEWLL